VVAEQGDRMIVTMLRYLRWRAQEAKA